MENVLNCDVTILLPAYNEEKRLEICVNETIKIFESLNVNYEIIIVENGSTDHTFEIAQKAANKFHFIKAIHLDKPSLGGAIREGYSLAKGQVIINLDVDLATDMSYMKDLLHYSNDFDVVTGSRYVDKSLVQRNFERHFLSVIFNKVFIRGLLHSKLKDNNCGFRAIKKNVGKSLFSEVKENGVFGLVELIVLAQKRGYKVKEFPVKWKENPRKVTVKDILNYLIPTLELWKRLTFEKN